MKAYEKRVLGALVDSYEGSGQYYKRAGGSRHKDMPDDKTDGESKTSRTRFFYRFNRKTIPEYFEESSLEYEQIHEAMRQLEAAGFLEIIWKGKRVGHIIEKVALREDRLGEIYQYLRREPKADRERRNMELIRELEKEWGKEPEKNPAVMAFLERMGKRLKAGLSVREYLDPDDMKKTCMLVKAVACVERNQGEMFIREFSIRHFADSKVFENMMGMVGRILRETLPAYEKLDTGEILAEYQIYHTPNYVYVKGNCGISLGDHGGWVELSSMKNGIGIPGDQISRLRITGTEQICRVITVENLTTFFRWHEQKGILIYLGGYHNRMRQQFLMRLFEQLPMAEWLHFGDIDWGGFQIFGNLRQKTGIPFQTFCMDMETLKKYEAFGKHLTAGDRKGLSELAKELEGEEGKEGEETGQEKESKWGKERGDIRRVVEYMLEHDVKLEQECVEKPNP